jgi:sugar/nucleoside kinase (ribokinase family)
MSLLVVGSIAYDDIETPFGKANNSPGGSALYFSAAASLFIPVNVVGVVGDDFKFSDIEFLSKRKVDFGGIKKESGKTFRWGGKYQKNMNLRDTLYTNLNVFENFNPIIPDQVNLFF